MMANVLVLFVVICATDFCLFAQGIPARLRGGETRRLLEEVPRVSVDMFQKLNALGKVRGQFLSFYDPYLASKESTASRDLPADKELLRKEAANLNEHVKQLHVNLKKDAQNVREFLEKLKRCRDDGSAEAAGREHEVQLAIWKVTEIVHQIEEVLKADDKAFGDVVL
ncbi:UNVERIFIED_CONTAM: hypothetical protein HHA_244260 [Hammondia hammondi]|eukprot:XP_008884275.1 hypothetical protein HHA_244260 [Hammondia hammondi]